MPENKPTREEYIKAARDFEVLSRRCKAAAEGRDPDASEFMDSVRENFEGLFK